MKTRSPARGAATAAIFSKPGGQDHAPELLHATSSRRSRQHGGVSLCDRATPNLTSRNRPAPRARPFCFNPDRLEALSASEAFIRGTPASSGTQAQANWSTLRIISLFDVEDAHQRGGRVQVPALCSFFSLPSLQSI
jgi:hypothetical protein